MEKQGCNVHSFFYFPILQTKIGPIIIALNPHRGLSQDQVLEHSQPSQYPHLQKLAQRVHAQLVEQRRPQAVILRYVPLFSYRLSM